LKQNAAKNCEIQQSATDARVERDPSTNEMHILNKMQSRKYNYSTKKKEVKNIEAKNMQDTQQNQ